MGIFDFFKSNRGPRVRKIAHTLGYQYLEKEDRGLLHLLRDFKLMQKGGNKKIRHLLWKNDPQLEFKIRVFEYYYTISTGKSSRTFKQSVFFIQSPQLGLPKFYLQPEHFFHRMSTWFGMNDFDFADYPEFSKAYHLKGEDEELVRITFSGKVLTYFTRETGWHVEGLNYFLLLYHENELLEPEFLPSFIQKGQEVFEVFKGEGYTV